MEIEVPVKRPRTFYSHKEEDISLQLETVLMAIYYPAALGTGRGSAPDGGKNWSKQLWLPRPRSKVAKGYGKFAGVGVSHSRQEAISSCIYWIWMSLLYPAILPI